MQISMPTYLAAGRVAVASPFSPAPTMAPSDTGALQGPEDGWIRGDGSPMMPRLAPGGLRPEDVAAAAEAPTKRQGARLALTGLMLAGTLLGVAGTMLPAPAFAQSASTVSMDATPTISAEDAALGRRYHVPPEVMQRAARQPDLVRGLHELPTDVMQRYGDMNANQRQAMVRHLSGSTRIAFVTINHKDAFIKGTAMGVDAFPKMKEQLDDDVTDGRLKSSEAEQLKSTLDRVKELSQDQRSTIARFILLERAAK